MDTAMLIGSLVPIIAIIFSALIILIPVAGLTLRFALKPAIEAYARLRSTPDQDQMTAVLEQRLTLVEQQLHHIENSLRQLEDKRDFDQHLLGSPAGRGESAAKSIPVYKTEG